MNIRIPLALLAAFGLFARPANAQCPGPDGLVGPCCATVTPNLPAFPGLALEAQGDCWDSCNLIAQTCLKTAVGTPIASALQCTQYVAPIEVFDCAGLSLMKGALTLDYTRTWEEFPVVGAAPVQVWRFAAKVDFFAPTTPPPCPVPPCAAATATGAFFYGYVDYVLDCSTNLWTGAVVLFHNCDDFIHGQPWSSNPGTWHPTRTYAVVAPDTAANPFFPSATPPTTGPLAAEAMRVVSSTFAPPLCFAEEPIGLGVYVNIAMGCICPINIGPVRNSAVRLSATGVCGGAFTSLNFWPLVPWFEMITTSIGRWSTTAGYPGQEEAHVAEGLFSYRDTCDAAGIVKNSVDVFYGGITEGGFPAMSLDPGVLLTQRFVDLASNFSSLLPGPVMPPFFGAVSTTDHLIYVNF